MNQVILGADATEAEDMESAVQIPVDAYISPEYVKLERDKLWRKVWLQAGRVEDIPKVGSYITFNILDDSILIVRASESEIHAFHNVCPHRGRRLVDTPPGERNAHGQRAKFFCGYHGWGFDLDGKNNRLPKEEDWKGAVTSGCSGLAKVKVDVWGGWLWINMDPDSESLAEYLAPIPEMLDPFQLQNMRPRWRQWTIFDCNWKVALEAFNELYHVETTHPEFNKFASFPGWGRAQGKHSHIGYDSPKGTDGNQSAKLRVGTGDARISTAEMVEFTLKNANTNFTQTLFEAAKRLVDELPEGTPSSEVLMHWLASAKADDAKRGVFWPDVPSEHVAKSGTSWQVFPNFQIGHAVNNALCYSARPYGYDPDKCIFEASVYELYPEGGAPETEWKFVKNEDWPYVLLQDFSNMAAVQQGMKSLGFAGARPNPYMERSTSNLHRNLAKYMGIGMPRKLKGKDGSGG